MAREMERVPLTNAFVRTTTAITVFHGGIKVCMCGTMHFRELLDF